MEAAADGGEATLTDNKEDALTSSHDTFLPFDITSGDSTFSVLTTNSASMTCIRFYDPPCSLVEGGIKRRCVRLFVRLTSVCTVF